MKNYFKARCICIILLSAGYGWAGGHFIPPESNFVAYIFQFIVIGILLWLGSNFMYTGVHESPPNWAISGLSIFSSLSFIINVLNIIYGAFNHDPHSFGSHNSFADLVPISFLLAGSGIWIFTIFLDKAKNSTA